MRTGYATAGVCALLLTGCATGGKGEGSTDTDPGSAGREMMQWIDDEGADLVIGGSGGGGGTGETRTSNIHDVGLMDLHASCYGEETTETLRINGESYEVSCTQDAPIKQVASALSLESSDVAIEFHDVPSGYVWAVALVHHTEE